VRGVAVVLALNPLLALGPAAGAGAEHGAPGTAQLASRATGPAPVPAATTNNSFLGENIDSSGLNAAVRTVSADGNRIVSASDADGLSTEDDNRYRNVFVRDRSAQTTILVSRAGGPSGDAANDDSFEPTISADGTVVAFTTRASNLGDNAPANSDNKVYVRTIATGATKLVSRATGASGVTLFYRGRAIGIARTSRARAGQRLVVLKVYVKGRKALRKVGKAALTARLTAKDALGNSRKVSKRFTLRR